MTARKTWKLKRGAKPKFKSPDELWEKACGYFEWVEQNPLLEHKPYVVNGVIEDHQIIKMRPMTVVGLCLHLNIDHQTLQNYEKKEEFKSTIEMIKNVIYEQKFSGAAAGLLNGSLIARELGLADNTKQEITGANGEKLIPDSITIKYE